MAIFDPAVWFWVPLALAVLLLLPAVVAGDRVALSFWSAVSFTFVAASLAATAAWVWLLRDGMGPSSVRTAGAQAWGHFWSQFIVPFAIDSAWIAVIAGNWRWRLRTLRRTEGAQVAGE